MVSTPITSNMHTSNFFIIFSYQLVLIIASIDQCGASNGDHPSTLNLTSMAATATASDTDTVTATATDTDTAATAAACGLHQQ